MTSSYVHRLNITRWILLFFLREAENPLAHEPDSDNICKLCDMYNIPLATNLATAELLVKSLERGDMEWREIYQ